MNAHHIEHIKLAVINDGNGSICGDSYEDRLATARHQGSANGAIQYSSIVSWAAMVDRAASKWEPNMTAADRLRCAAELADYYAEHIKEVDEGD